MKELLIGCGASRNKQFITNNNLEWSNLITLDHNKDHEPDVLWDLTSEEPLPFEDNSIDEIHAYEVLQQIGSQGNYKTFFRQFSDYWRILKPSGCLWAIVPSWNCIWAFGDPSHGRIINQGTLAFLSQEEYKKQIGITPMTDFRFCYKADFNIVGLESSEIHLKFVLQAIKPSRIDKKYV